MTDKRVCKFKDCKNKYYAKGYCSKHYANFRRHGSPDKPVNKKPIKFEVVDGGCFVCCSHSKNSDGYPIISINGKSRIMSRFVYTEMHGEISDGLVIRHKCDNPSCINPEHLLVGTQAENESDKRERGRIPRGEKHHNSKLKNSEVLQIRELLLQGVKNREIAKVFGINEKVVSNIKHRKRWDHI